MYWLTENSLVPMLSGVFLVFVFLGLAIWEREKRLFYAALIVGAVTSAIVLCEFMVVTDQEAVTECVRDLALKVRSNDKPGVVGYISRTRPDTIDRVNSEMPLYHFEECRILGTKTFESAELDGKKMATVVFVVFARVRTGGMPELIPVQREIRLDFTKETDGQWRVIDYSHKDPRKGVAL